MNNDPLLSKLIIQPYCESDSLTEITDLLHRAYKPLAEMGMNFVASYQSEDETAERIADGVCLLGTLDGQLIATVTYKDQIKPSIHCYYDTPGVAMFGQFAVDPHYQKIGIGSLLLNEVEHRVREAGAKELALDTSERAEDLIHYYERKGFRFIEHVQWQRVNYRSVIMSKPL